MKIKRAKLILVKVLGTILNLWFICTHEINNNLWYPTVTDESTLHKILQIVAAMKCHLQRETTHCKCN